MLVEPALDLGEPRGMAAHRAFAPAERVERVEDGRDLRDADVASVSGRDDGKPARFALDTKPFTMQLLWAAALRRAFTLLST